MCITLGDPNSVRVPWGEGVLGAGSSAAEAGAESPKTERQASTAARPAAAQAHRRISTGMLKSPLGPRLHRRQLAPRATSTLEILKAARYCSSSGFHP